MENLITLSKHLALFLVATIHGFGPRLFSAQKVKAVCLSIFLQHNPPHSPPPNYCRAWECLISTLYVGRALGESLPHFQNFSSSKGWEIQPHFFSSPHPCHWLSIKEGGCWRRQGTVSIETKLLVQQGLWLLCWGAGLTECKVTHIIPHCAFWPSLAGVNQRGTGGTAAES